MARVYCFQCKPLVPAEAASRSDNMEIATYIRRVFSSLLRGREQSRTKYYSPCEKLAIPIYPDADLKSFRSSRCIRRMQRSLFSPAISHRKNIPCVLLIKHHRHRGTLNPAWRDIREHLRSTIDHWHRPFQAEPGRDARRPRRSSTL